MAADFEKLIQRRGAYSLPYLIHLYDDGGKISLYFINDVKDVSFGGNTYKAAAFSYTPNAAVMGFSGGGTLSIETDGNYVINLTDNNYTIRLDVIGALMEDGSVTEIRTYSHRYGKASFSKGKCDFTFDKDDRLQMTFPALIWSHLNNRGNS